MNITNIDELKQQLESIVLENTADVDIVKWFNQMFVKWFVSADDDHLKPVDHHEYKPTEPEWMNRSGMFDFSRFTDSESSFLEGDYISVQDIKHVVKYFQSLDNRQKSKIYKQSGKIIFEKTKNFILTTAPVHDLVENIDYNVLRKVKKQWMWVELLSHKAYTNEGEQMGHCSGNYNTNEQRLISLWDSKLRSHVTIEIWSGEITQIKGKENMAPAPGYITMTSEFVNHLLSSGIPVVSDGQNIGWVAYNPNKVLKLIKQIPDPITGEIITGRRYVDPDTDKGNTVLNTVIKPHRIIRLGNIVENCSYNQDGNLVFNNNGLDEFNISDMYLTSIDEINDIIIDNKQQILDSIINRIGRSDVEKLNKIIRKLNRFTKITEAEGVLDLSGNMMKNLQNLPSCEFVVANNNMITELRGLNEHVRWLQMNNNMLKDLRYLPKEWYGSLMLADNALETLTDGDDLQDMTHLDVSHNRLKSLRGSPRIIGNEYTTGHFVCNNNLLESLSGGPDVVFGDYDVSGNPLTDISSLPRKVYGNLFITKTSICDDVNHKYITDNCRVKGDVNIL